MTSHAYTEFKYDEMLSSFAFNYSLCPCYKATAHRRIQINEADLQAALEATHAAKNNTISARNENLVLESQLLAFRAGSFTCSVDQHSLTVCSWCTL